VSWCDTWVGQLPQGASKESRTSAFRHGPLPLLTRDAHNACAHPSYRRGMALRRPDARDEGGQASVELVATLPALIAVTVLVVQAAIAGWALWSAANAARAGARAAYVGGSARRAARSALPSPLRDGSRVRDSGEVQVRVRAPLLVPGLPGIPVSASAGLDPDGGDSG
jgi:TadE-like protein